MTFLSLWFDHAWALVFGWYGVGTGLKRMIRTFVEFVWASLDILGALAIRVVLIAILPVSSLFLAFLDYKYSRKEEEE